jgi:hypothetical protein
VVDRVWCELPEPRVRIDLDDFAHVDQWVASAASDLLRLGRQEEVGREPPADHMQRKAMRDPDDGRPESMELVGHGGKDDGDMRHVSESTNPDHRNRMSHPEHEGMDGSGHEGTDRGRHGGHGSMEMAPHGIPLAGGGEDRDGLEMDVLHLALGPVLRFWPAGLVLRCSLQGDVVTDATVGLLDATRRVDEPADHTGSAVMRARQIDRAAGLLALTGWADAASAAHRVRDLLLDGRGEDAAAMLRRLRGRVARSWLLRWSLHDVGRLGPEVLAHHGLPARLAGDVRDRLLALLDGALTEWPHGAEAPTEGTAASVLAALPALVAGLELAHVRLLVASLALDGAMVSAGTRRG